MCAETLSVMNFYERKSIFITGATGSMGKLLMEKLLRSCSNIERIYVLIRPKRGKSSSERLTNLFNAPIFDKLHEMDPSVFSKVIIVDGDMCRSDLGLRDDDKTRLVEDISIVFHCAASLRFDAKLKDAIEDNVFGTRNLLQLCHRMQKIEAFVHVSTLYSTCNKSTIEERVPVIPALEGKLDFTKNIDDFVKTIPPDVVAEWPNTYTFSKALTEIMLNDQRGTLPISIVRPSIVLSTLREPMAGWIDNFYGPTLSIANSALGILRSVICDGNKVADVIPSDFVVNLLICVGCKTKYAAANEVKVYNCCSGRQNPMRSRQLLIDCNTYIKLYPVKAAVRYPNITYRTSYLVHYIVSTIQHRFFSYVIDFIALIASRRRRMVGLQGTISRVMKSLDYFTLRQWSVTDQNVESLNNELSKMEKNIFYFDVRAINWASFARSYALGIRRYLLKEDMSNLSEAMAKMNRLYWIEKMVELFLWIVSFIVTYRWFYRRHKKT